MSVWYSAEGWDALQAEIAELRAEIERLKAENERLKNRPPVYVYEEDFNW
jgi:cell division protein FtsB